jgi:hypothetical protein
MRWKMKFLMAVTILVVSTTASPGYSEFLAGGEFPILGAVSVGRGEQAPPRRRPVFSEF